MKRLGCVVLGLCATLLAGVALCGAWLLAFERQAVVPADISVEVAPGEGVLATLERLQRQRAVQRDVRWGIWTRLRAASATIEAGAHRLQQGATPSQVLDALGHAQRTDVVRVVIPEGLNVWQTAELFEQSEVCDGSGFVAVALDPQVSEGLGVGSSGLEGYLFPDTYDFVRGTTPLEVAERLVERARRVHAAAGVAAVAIDEIELDAAEVIVLASLVEREAAVAEERPRIARVFLNRLRAKMKLQTDPTCVYGPDRWRERPSRARCHDAASRWSTYVIEGLPPTPIASPGRASIEAVLRPGPPSADLYFVSMEDGTGRHAFAASLEEHNANVRRYLRSGD